MMAQVESATMCSGLFHPGRSANHASAGASQHTQLAPAGYPTPLNPLSSRPFVVHSGRRSTQRTNSELRHDNYIDKLEVPTLEQISSIAQIQEEKEREIQRKYVADDESTTQQQERAAEKIQRTYRGHRARRQMQGLTLDPSTRWIDALKSARYQAITDPGSRRGVSTSSNASPTDRPSSAQTGDQGTALSQGVQKSMDARSNWHHISSIASHAVGELPRPSSGTESRSHSRQSSRVSSKHAAQSTDIPEHLKVPERNPPRLNRSRDKPKDPWAGKMMDLPYFLEMVDVKHRYGSNLRAYHEQWMKADTNEPYFWWLDYGDGKDVEVPNVSRKRLEREQVRYLSREERLNYLVRIDDEGRIVWAKSGDRVHTSPEFKDSINGIVSIDSDAKGWREDEIKASEDDTGGEKESDDSSSVQSGSPPISPIATPSLNEAERRYPDPPNLREAKGPAKAGHVSAQAIVNRLLRKTLVAKNTWIFAVDTNMNMFMGIKQSGSFQHSSFMRGSRLSSAGTIKIKNGQIRAINPLSGHYRPPAKAFRHFVHHLKDAGADMSRVSISKSYAILVGLEMYTGGCKKVKEAEKKVKRGAGMVIHPAKTKELKDNEKDNSQSAQKEREIERDEKGPLGRVLEDAKAKVEERWAALDAKRVQDKSPQDVQQVPDVRPDRDVPHQEALDRAYKDAGKEDPEIHAQVP